MKKQFLLFFASIFLSSFLFGQSRYLDPIFEDDEIEVEYDVTYGVNASFLLAALKAPDIREELKMDVYMPADDEVAERPVVVMMHAGDFLPPALSMACYGTRNDAYVVAMARRLTRMGYVVCNADYRLGWAPADTSETIRRFTIINAAFRGVQDSRTAVKFLKKSVVDDANPFGIDSSRVVLWGVGTGAVVSYASATLDNVEDTWIPKFILQGSIPMILPPINGDLEANDVGIAPSGYPPFEPGDTVSHPNHVGYNGNFQLAVQLGGALGDTSWVDESDVPMISVHIEEDPDNRCEKGISEALGEPVVEVFGGCTAIPLANTFGLNESFDVEFTDPISEVVNSQVPWGGNPGLYVMNPTPAEQSATWDFASSSMPNSESSANNCNTDSASAFLVIDSILAYVAPRACLALNLGCNLENIVSSVEQIQPASIGLNIFPNPAEETLSIQTDGTPIQQLQLYDAQGRLLQNHKVENDFYLLKRATLNPGMYFILLQVEGGFVSQKIMFK